ncbi:MAG: aldo/keto reductase [Synechococcaceae cyanobacterium SM2_3_2]|nr:aldo/keto reductase [Synechococcaceae cyanobacterium SM2_3_2]
MEYRRFGRTELSMPVFSCGGMRYQHKWQDQPWEAISVDNQQNLEATICRALEVGINHIETARGYGTSEMQLGRILPRLAREQLIVQTKIGPRSEPDQFVELFQRSMGYLNLDYVDLLGIHGINTWEQIEDCVKPGGCLDRVQEWIQQGRVRHVGFSTHGPTDVIVAAINTGRFDYVNLHWYYINQSNWPAIAAAQAQDMGVFIISPSDKGGRLYDPPAKLVRLCEPLSPMVFNDLFCLSQPQVHTLSLGAARPSDFDEHLKVLPLLDQADRLLPPILARLEQALVDTLGEPYAKTWQEGLPTYDATPGNVNISMILRLYHLAAAFDMVEFSRERYSLLGNGGHWFPGQKADQKSVSALKTALQHSPNRDQILQILPQADQLLGGTEGKRLSQSAG